MTFTHISDTHLKHESLKLPKVDCIIHSGDEGSRTTPIELYNFMEWFNKQEAQLKIFIAGNHSICLDWNWVISQKKKGKYEGEVAEKNYKQGQEIINSYKDIKYLNNSEYIYEGIKFYGSPITPSFHRQYWAFNADRGEEINKYWAQIPTDVNVLITHGPPYGMLDVIPESFKSSPDEDTHRGCKDLLNVIKKRLLKLRLNCFGHLHSSYGVVLEPVSNTRNVLFSNGSVLDEDYNLIIKTPLIITI